MKFKQQFVPWIDEIENYLTESGKNKSELKKVLKGSDLSAISYADQAKLTSLFNPNCEITEELFKRQLDLYFSLIEDKKSPITVPIFSNYIDWIYSQDVSKLTDTTLDIVSSRLLKSTATKITPAMESFIDSLPGEFNKDIDTLSNARLSILINILKEINKDYKDMPDECKKFVKNMFIACAVKTEIADRNKNKFRGMFRDDPRYYYGIFNKAFAGVGEYGSWIDEPAKKMTLKNMINYANFQRNVLENTHSTRLDYYYFDRCAKNLNLPRMPEYDSYVHNGSGFYLKQPREYKDYAKKLGYIFVQMLNYEMCKFAENLGDGILDASNLEPFAATSSMASNFANIANASKNEEILLNRYAGAMIDMVHLDDLTGLAPHQIYNEEQALEVLNAGKSQVKPSYAGDIRERIFNGTCTQADLDELYEMYYKDPYDYEIQNTIVSLEDRFREEKENIQELNENGVSTPKQKD